MYHKKGEIKLNPNTDFPGYQDVMVSWEEQVYTTELKLTTLGEIFQTIKSNTEIEKRIEIVHQAKNQKEKQERKSNLLPYFIIGQFDSNKRDKRELISTQYMIFDYDHIGNRLKSKLKTLKDDNRVNFLFTSPSGSGFKVGYKLDKPITDYETFSAIYKYYAAQFGLELGEKADKTSAASQPCYFSFDPDIYTEPNSEKLPTNIPDDELKKYREYSETDWDEVKAALSGMNIGQRTPIARTMIGMMVNRNIPKDVALGLIKGWNLLNSPPFSENEIISLVDDLYNRYGEQIDTVPIKFIDKGNVYFKRVYWNKEWQEVQVTTFRMIPKELLVLEDGDCLVCDLVTPGGYHYADIKIENTDWHTKQKFLKALKHQDCTFLTSDQDLQAFCQFIQVSIPIRKEATKVVGLYKNQIWVTENYNITKDSISREQKIVPYDKGKDAFYHGIDYKDLTDDEYRDMITVFYENVLKLNELEKITSYLGWIFAAPIKPLLNEIADGFPLLFNHGSQGAGKSSLAQLFMRLIGYTNPDPKSCTMKLFPMLKMLSSTNAIPQWYDEFKKADMKETDVDNLLRYMRRAYKGEVEDKGRADQTVETYNITAPMAVMGEWNINQPAIMERVILIRFNEYVKKNKESQEAFRALKSIDLEAFMPRYIQYCLSQDVNELFSIARDIVLKEFDSISVAPRIITNLSILIVGLELFKGFAEAHQVKVPELDYQQILNYQLKEITGSNNGSVKSAVDQLIEELAIMAEKEEIKSFYHYKKVKTDNSVNALAIRFNKIFPDFVVFANRTSYEGDLLDKSSYLKMFDDCDYIIQKNMAVKMDGKTHRCLVLDIDKVIAKGLNIDGLLEEKESEAKIEDDTLIIGYN